MASYRAIKADLSLLESYGLLFFSAALGQRLGKYKQAHTEGATHA